jgi:hypothetical protein
MTDTHKNLTISCHICLHIFFLKEIISLQTSPDNEQKNDENQSHGHSV